MKLEEFKSGIYQKEYHYSSFLPAKVNHEWNWENSEINVLLEKATGLLGELNAFSFIVPDVDLFIQMHVMKEANTSSRIEGTRTEIDEAVMDIEEILPEKRDDWREVQNYVKAINYAVEQLEKLPLSNRLLKETHSIIMDSVRGEHKTPGDFRKSQNWIGGSSIKDAVYIPPNHNELSELMGDLEKFLHNNEIAVPHLVKISIAHYQFETIHPFLDGNGRIGRLLITLYLVSQKLLQKPSLYLSDYFEKNRNSYYDALSRIRESNDLIHWVKFFLNGIIRTAENGKETFIKIMNLKNGVDHKIITLGRKAENAKKLMELLYRKPIVSVKDVEKFLNVTPKTANAMIDDFENIGILSETTGQSRNRIFVFRDYIVLF